MLNFSRNRAPSWWDYVDDKKTCIATGIVWKENTPPEMIKQYKDYQTRSCWD